MKKMTKRDVEQMKYVERYWYLATVYTKHPDGCAEAYDAACRWSAFLLRAGIPHFAPICMTHGASKNAPLSHEKWLEVDRPFMLTANGLIVIMMDNWRESEGIADEISTFRKQGKPIMYVDQMTGEFFYEEV
jgi:hypothetical protein